MEYPTQRFFNEQHKPLKAGVTTSISLATPTYEDWCKSGCEDQVKWDGDTPRFLNAEELAVIEAERKLNEYNQLVVEKIRLKYTQNDEFALIADGIADSTNAAYVAYRAYVAQCKVEAHNEVYGS